MNRVARASCALLMLTVATPVFAQGTAGGPKERPQLDTPAADRPEPTPEQFEEAKRRYNRAIELFNEGSYDASLLEFRRAYELAPSYRILYNVALVNVQLNDYAQALDYFERYLEEGGAEIPEERVQEVKSEITRLTGRVANVTFKINVPTAQLTLDDMSVGSLPRAKPLRVNAGRRRITVASKGKLPQTRVVELAGGDDVTLEFRMREPRKGTETVYVRDTRPPEKTFPWPAWIGTAVLAAGAGVTGALALQANSELDDEKGSYDPARNPADKQSDLEALRDKRRNFAVATDVLAGAAIVLGGISLYLTLDDPEPEKPAKKQRVNVGVGPQGVSFGGTF